MPPPLKRAWILTALLLAAGSVRGQDTQSSRKVGLNGSMSASLSHYNANQDIQVRDPITWLLSANATVRFVKWSLPFSVTLSQQRKDIGTPTFARIGASPTWSWGKAHLGYRSMRLSEFTVGGTTFLGAGLELNPGILRFAVLGGRFADAREDDEVEGIRARYERRGYGFKVGLGSEATHVDVIMFKAQDDSTSLEMPPIDSRTTPMDNLVLGVDAAVSPVQPVKIFAEVAASALNRDIRSEEIETDVPSIITDLFQPRESAQANLALRGGVDVSYPLWGVRAEYLWVEPDYQTLGSYFFNTDVQSITLSPRVALAQGRVNVTVSGGYSRNNLYDDLAQTTERLVGSANLNWRVTRGFRLGVMYSNYSSDQSSGIIETTDSTRVTNVSQNIGLMPQFQWGGETRHSLSFRGSQQNYNQTSIFTGIDNDTQTRNIGLNYSINMTQSDLKLRFTATNLNSETPTTELTTQSISAGITKGLAEGMVNIDFRVGLRRRDRGADQTSTNVTSQLGISIAPSRWDSISIRSQFTTRSAVTADVDSVNEFMNTITYSRRFAI